jgi:integrase
VKLPANKASKPTKITVAQLRALEAAAPPRFAAMIHLSAWAGLRWQEAAALRWGNVDLARGLLVVTEAIKQDRKVGATKNERTRVVHIAPETVEVLTAHRRDFGAGGLLFGNRFGRPLDYASFRRNVWKPLVGRCGLDPRPTYHDLRHSYAAHCVDAGLDPRALQEAMGHHSAGFTMSRYGWATDNAGSAVVAAVQAAMGGRPV